MLPEIRLLEMNDRERMERFFDQMGTYARMFFDRGGGNRSWCMKFFDGSDTKVMRRWVAVEDDEIVGYVFLWDVDTKIPWLGIATAEKMRGRHLGRALLEHVEKWCRENDKGGIMLTTHMANIYAQVLYESCGYHRLGVCSDNNELFYLRRF